MKIIKYLKNNIKSIIAVVPYVTIWIMLSLFTGSLCWIRAVTGFPCPGCGSTRAVICLFRFQFREALRFHPLIFLSLAVIVYYIVKALRGDIKNIYKTEKYSGFAIVIIFIAIYIIRMILLFPHTEPMTILDTALWQRILQLILNFKL